jgi:ABC-type multidrug transport system ATPase subunit
MQVKAEQIGKRYGKDWIFRDLNISLSKGNAYAITGANGSGKSTLLQCLAGSQPLTEGTVLFSENSENILPEDFYKKISFASPYLELIEEFTLEEHLLFHQKFKPFIKGITAEHLAEIMLLEKAWKKEIRHFSSGMKQRVKLALALYSDSAIVMLDEPTVNLDDQGIDWYQEHVLTHRDERIILVCSNQSYEYSFCNEVISLQKLHH